MNILIIEDEKISRISLANTIRKEGFDVDSADSAESGLELFEKHRHHVVVTDLRLPNASGMHVLSTVLARSPETKVVIITAYATVETAIAALRLGAYDYLTKPFSPEKLLSILRNLRRLLEVVDENRELKNKLHLLEKRPLVGVSSAIRHLTEQIALVAQSDSTVLIEGESGTGKEVVARSIHLSSPRGNHPFIVVSSAGIPESLLESELFGHEKGAFTGAIRRHIGYFERAQRGSIFIDDIDDLPMTMQVKLLRVLQEREIVRVGGSESVSIDVRIIAATKIDLRRQVERGHFREDLFYRLNILPLRIPPLRDRKEDIPVLAEHFFKKYSSEKAAGGLSEELLPIFLAHDWPGNVRELENMVQRVIAHSQAGALDVAALGITQPTYTTVARTAQSVEYPPYEEFMIQREREIVGWALQKSGNNVSEAARLLKIPRTTLTSRIPKLFPAFARSAEQNGIEETSAPSTNPPSAE